MRRRAPNTARRHREQKREIRGGTLLRVFRSRVGQPTARFYPVSLKHCLSQFPSSRREDSRITPRSRASPKDISLPLSRAHLLSISPSLRCLSATLTLRVNPRSAPISEPIRTHNFAQCRYPCCASQRKCHVAWRPAMLC